MIQEERKGAAHPAAGRRLVVGVLATGLLLMGAPASAESSTAEKVIKKARQLSRCPLYTITLTSTRATHSRSLLMAAKYIGHLDWYLRGHAA